MDQVRTGHAGPPVATLQPLRASRRAAKARRPGRCCRSPQNTVLRNTYWLLALSMLPTIVGAFVGMQLNFFAFFKASPIMAPLLMFGLMIGLAVRRDRAAQQQLGRGGAVRVHVHRRAGAHADPDGGARPAQRRPAHRPRRRHDGGDLLRAGRGSPRSRRRTSPSWASSCSSGVILLIVASIANLFFQVPAASVTLSAIAVLIFSAYILYDVSRIVHGGETNYIMATMGLFLNIYNIFISLLNILMAFTGNRD